VPNLYVVEIFDEVVDMSWMPSTHPELAPLPREKDGDTLVVNPFVVP
jgi:hypothetical protein